MTNMLRGLRSVYPEAIQEPHHDHVYSTIGQYPALPHKKHLAFNLKDLKR